MAAMAAMAAMARFGTSRRDEHRRDKPNEPGKPGKPGKPGSCKPVSSKARATKTAPRFARPASSEHPIADLEGDGDDAEERRKMQSCAVTAIACPVGRWVRSQKRREQQQQQYRQQQQQNRNQNLNQNQSQSQSQSQNQNQNQKPSTRTSTSTSNQHQHQRPPASPIINALSPGSNDVLLDRHHDIRLVPLNQPVVRFRLRAISRKSRPSSQLPASTSQCQPVPANASQCQPVLTRAKTKFCLGPWQSSDPPAVRRPPPSLTLKPHAANVIGNNCILQMQHNGEPHSACTPHSRGSVLKAQIS
ncbi:hypothetical protein AOQ84DRAFT_222902 [Glonium stellatum]|uniref:Uncharacterized protein n=1 Tax=Glonium stellatum TaxID=574774 RepID=A0A8E2JSD7_9PEZI|nr:hypothetical protein AOQ84DRAFT_222902 [Glonium stellatum]